jgi:hypothetical protein
LAHEQSVCVDRLLLPGTGEGHDEFDPSDTDPHKGADFHQFQPDRRGGATANPRSAIIIPLEMPTLEQRLQVRDFLHLIVVTVKSLQPAQVQYLRRSRHSNPLELLI